MKVALKVDRNQAEVLANNSTITADFHKKVPINKKDLSINKKPSMAGFCLFNELSYIGFARTKTRLSRGHLTFYLL